MSVAGTEDGSKPPGRSAEHATTLSVLMPVCNERRTLRTIVRRVLASPLPVPLELIIVDDGSTDGSGAIARELAEADPRIQVFAHDRNRGKGAAIRTAIAQMTGEIAVVQDADLEYDPDDLPRLIQPILDGRADAVYGSRFLSAEYRRVLYYWHTLGNQLLTTLANIVCDWNLTDMETGYKAVRADILRQTPLRYDGFAFEPELTVRLAQWGARLYEVPVRYAGRTYVEGKKVGWLDGFKAIGTLLWCRFFATQFTTHDGYDILVAVRRAKGFNRWMFRQVEPFVGRRILEAGCGIGNLTERMLDADRLLASDFDPFYVEMIGRRFGHLENIETLPMDLTDPQCYEALRAERLDTILCLNVLEHIEADEHVLALFHRALAPGGHAVILVPQHPWLYADLDRVLGHYRRYEPEELRAKLERAGFEVVHQQDFNRLGTLGWYVNGRVLKRARLSPGQMKTFNRLLPLAKLIERIPAWPALSTIAVGRKSI